MIRRADPELVFMPLGGVGEIGMNLGLYGYGPPHDRTWLAVDLGVAFAGPDLPGVDLILPDISYIEEERTNLAGIVLTHAHEDHFGAMIDLWPRLRVPVYATAFTANLISAKLASEPGKEAVPVTVVEPRKPFTVGPFNVELINVAHSIPESNALAIRTPAGLVLHSGDWKIDETPVVSPPTDAKRLRELGDEGVLALVCDSTNAIREGKSPSETEVGKVLTEIVRAAKGRVAFTTFASNVGRIRSIALAAAAADREVVVVGRAMRRVIDVAGELGYLDGLRPFLDEEAYPHLPRGRTVALLTGSQGEPRAALARVATEDHRNVELVPGDTVVFSSRAIPGNEKAVNNIVNALVARGVLVVTDRDALVHVSGHPRRDELREMYSWLRPKVAVPVHGEAMHLAAHADFARSMGVETVLTIHNGIMVRLGPGRAEKVDEIEAGRLYKDGALIGGPETVGVAERRRLSFSGHAGVLVMLDAKGNVLGDPEVELVGLPLADASGRPMEEAVIGAVFDTLDSLPRPLKRDPDVVREAVRRAVRAAVNEIWGKKPVCTVFVAVL
jgi:ribonuclease J